MEHDDDDRSNEDLEEQLPLSSKGWRALMETYTRGIKRSVFGEPPRAFSTLRVRFSPIDTRYVATYHVETGFSPLQGKHLGVASNRKKESRRVGARRGKEGFEIDLLERVLIVERRN